MVVGSSDDSMGATAHLNAISVLGKLLLGRTSAPWLAVAAGLPVLAGAWLLLSPQRLVSREMTVDLLFNLSGAWRLLHEHVPHVDYHDPVGTLSFLLTRLGFYIVGPSPQAFLIGETAFLAFAFSAAVIVAARRLPPLPAALFVLYVALLVLQPANVGDQPNAYTLAMSYNRWCWSALTTLCLILFLPPRDKGNRAWVDAAVAGLLLLAMFYLKVTFAAAGLGALMVALVASDHIRMRWTLWGAVPLMLLANAAAPYSHAYLADLWEAASGGYMRTSWPDHVRSFLANKAEYALYGCGVLVLFWLWQRGRASWQPAFAAFFLLGMGVMVLSQNAQAAGVPIGIVIAFLIYDAVCTGRSAGAVGTLQIAPALLLLPLLSIAAAATTVVGYHIVARHGDALFTVESTNLRGLAVPAEVDRAQASFTAGEVPYQIRSGVRIARLSQDASDFDYVQGLVEAAALFTDAGRGPTKILMLDQVNALPFVLGYPPPRGGNLWLWPGPARSAEDVFGDVDIVLVPKKPSLVTATVKALAQYERYLAENFFQHEETPRWIIYMRRQSAALPPEPL
ncbi:MAG TPA: hypothetical protein VJR58_27130 [Vineibacter sp.]|nr:hypothetical protein [Vineibacter sp.]